MLARLARHEARRVNSRVDSARAHLSTGVSRESHLMGACATEYTFQVIVTELAEIESSMATTLWKKCSASASRISTRFSSNLISRSFEGAFNITSNGGV
jgi:hypothetical protein